jgi:acetyltransferase
VKVINVNGAKWQGHFSRPAPFRPVAGLLWSAMSPIYPTHLIRQVLWRGEQLLIRPVRAEDAAGYVAAAKYCSLEDISFRLLRGIREVSHQLISRFTEIDYEQTMAFVAEGVKGDILAVTRLVQDGCRKSAEYAIIVRTDLQRQGLGTLMQKMLFDYAAGLGLDEVWGVIDSENRKALSLVDRLGFSRTFQLGLPFVRVVKALG